MTRRPKATVLLSDGRSGTNYLISRIVQTGTVNFGWEPFNDRAKKYTGYRGFQTLDVPQSVLDRMNDKTFRQSDPDGYIDYCAGFTGAFDGTDVTVTGFKIFPIHNRDIFWRMTKDPRFEPIILQRRSVLLRNIRRHWYRTIVAVLWHSYH